MKAPAVKLGLYSSETLKYGKIKKIPLKRPGPLRIGFFFFLDSRVPYICPKQRRLGFK